MTHLSDYSFLQRAVTLTYLYMWFIYRIYALDNFKCLHPTRFRQGELKSIVSLLILIMVPFQLFYDVTSCKIKYEEGFANIMGHIFTKPEMMWTAADKALVVPTDYSLCIGFSLQTGTLLLLQCFWNYLANSVAKASFMSSREFFVYIVWTIVSILIFPLLQYNFSRDVYSTTLKEIIPELVYGCELLIVAVLGVISHFRFRKLLKNSKDSNNAHSITHKIRYFQELNLVLTILLFVTALSLIILSADGLTAHKTLNMYKFSADFLICNINVSSCIIWFVVILIFHPKQQAPANTLSSPSVPSHDFLSTAEKLPYEYQGSGIMVIQQSETSTDFIRYSKPSSSSSAAVQSRSPFDVPMTSEPSYTGSTHFHFNPRSSIGALLKNERPLNLSLKENLQSIPSMSSQPIHNPFVQNSSLADWESTLDYPFQQQQQQQQQQQEHPHDDWLHQSPRGRSSARSP